MGMEVIEKSNAEVLSGRQWVRVTGTAISLNTAPAGGAAIPLGCREVAVQADPSNANDVVVGAVSSTVTPATGIILEAGVIIVLPVDDVSKLYVNGTTPDAVCWVALR
jgi:hypothetical protein